MSTCLVSRTSTLLAVIQFTGDLLLLALGCSPLSRLTEPIYRIAKTLTWVAELTLLAIALVLSVTGDMAPTIGHHLGRAAGRVYRLGRLARRWYSTHAQEPLTAVSTTLNYIEAEQLGTAPSYQSLKQAIAPARLLSVSIAPFDTLDAADSHVGPALTLGLAVTTSSTSVVSAMAPARTRRELLAMAKAHHIRNYSRMNTASLRIALADCE